MRIRRSVYMITALPFNRTWPIAATRTDNRIVMNRNTSISAMKPASCPVATSPVGMKKVGAKVVNRLKTPLMTCDMTCTIRYISTMIPKVRQK
ncbi:hypothetical protein C7K25_14525 [Gulosibacter molinativorax]|uniref:Secreted protein n=1 Tax=Gulosibacter molinativorax TaxID=256821 RepID=A0ABT7CBI1_9MICO|nr:hypothetical protein [Gulosibacter molinativorax]